MIVAVAVIGLGVVLRLFEEWLGRLKDGFYKYNY